MTTTAATQAKPVTAGDLLRLCSEGVRGELIRGEFREAMPAGHQHGRIVVNLVVEMKNFVKPRKLGMLTASDSSVWLERDADTVRAGHCVLLGREDALRNKGQRLFRRGTRSGGGGRLSR